MENSGILGSWKASLILVPAVAACLQIHTSNYASAGKSIAAPVQGVAYSILEVANGAALSLLLSFLSAGLSSDVL
jgi:hypothetical protein